jgi:hypothetical protein
MSNNVNDSLYAHRSTTHAHTHAVHAPYLIIKLVPDAVAREHDELVVRRDVNAGDIGILTVRACVRV